MLEVVEDEKHGAFGGKDAAVGQAFSLLMCAYFTGLFLGLVCGGMVYYHFGWKIMTLTLGVLVFASAAPMLWLGGKPVAREQEKEHGGSNDRSTNTKS